MLRWIIFFLIIALVSAIFGFGGIYEAATDIAKILFYIFIVLLVITLVFGKKVFKWATRKFSREMHVEFVSRYAKGVPELASKSAIDSCDIREIEWTYDYIVKRGKDEAES